MGYAVAKSLAARGHRIVCAAARVPTMPGRLDGVLGEVAYPDPFIEPDRFVATIRDAARSWSVDAIFPVHEETFVLARHRESLGGAPLIAPTFRALLAAHDKLASYALARELAIDAPLTRSAASRAELRDAANEVGFPAILKPRFGSGANKVRRLRSAEDVDPAVRSWDDGPSQPMLVQRFRAGVGVGYGGLVWKGALRAGAGHVRLREVPIAGGTSTARRTFHHPRIAKAARALLERSGLDGVGMVEFRYDRGSDSFAFLEINPRYWGGVPTAIESGVDIPALHLAYATGAPAASAEVVTPSREIESRWVLGELRAVVGLASAGEYGRLAGVFQRDARAGLAFDDVSANDPWAFFHQMAAYAAGLVKHGSFGGHSSEKDAFFLREIMGSSAS